MVAAHEVVPERSQRVHADQAEEQARRTNSLALALLEQQRAFDSGETGE